MTLYLTDETSSTLKVNYYYDGSLPLAEKVDGKMKQIYINDGEGIVGRFDISIMILACSATTRGYIIYMTPSAACRI